MKQGSFGVFLVAIGGIALWALWPPSPEKSVEPVRPLARQAAFAQTIEVQTLEHVSNRHDALAPGDRMLVCRAAISMLMGRDIAIISATDRLDMRIVIASYVRPGDGKRWRFACRFDGNRVVWASIDESARIGRWRTDPLDGKVTFSLSDGLVTVTGRFSDGSTQRRSYPR